MIALIFKPKRSDLSDNDRYILSGKLSAGNVYDVKVFGIGICLGITPHMVAVDIIHHFT